MKKIITILALIMSLKGLSYPITIYYITPSHICREDTMHVFCKWDGSFGSSHFRFEPVFGQTWSFYWAHYQFYSCPKTLLGTDTIYEVKIQIPIFFMWPNGGPASVNIDLVTKIPFFMGCDVGIEEYELIETPSIYYDLYGNMVQPRNNTLLIQQTGRTRKKVVLTD